MRHLKLVCTCAFALLSLGTVAPAMAEDSAAGKALYESRCDACHDKSVHSRKTHKARNFAQIQSWVERWNRELGSAWSEAEILSVTRYLNERYYRYPCPPAACRDGKA